VKHRRPAIVTQAAGQISSVAFQVHDHKRLVACADFPAALITAREYRSDWTPHVDTAQTNEEI